MVGRGHACWSDFLALIRDLVSLVWLVGGEDRGGRGGGQRVCMATKALTVRRSVGWLDVRCWC